MLVIPNRFLYLSLFFFFFYQPGIYYQHSILVFTLSPYHRYTLIHSLGVISIIIIIIDYGFITIISNRFGDIYLTSSFQRFHYENGAVVYIPFIAFHSLGKLSVIKLCRLQSVCRNQWKQRKRVRGHGCFIRNMNVAIMLILLEAEKALCDTRCNTFLRSVLLCAYTDYYDHCDYYDDGNFFHNSPLLHSLVSTMQL